ncbi:hypothetical protein N7540_003480 [Penicillium herquei]|nr:hypothetical protein N7540_003480 [Penicillium herquei]
MSSTKIAKIPRPDLKKVKTLTSVPSITNVKHLSSYNWIESSRPTIAVPGCPSLWSPPKSNAPKRVPKDSGLLFVAQNAFRHPESPLEPLFRSLYIEHPSQHNHILSETETHVFLRPGEFRGHGHEFEKAFTRDQIPGTTGHHRIISYSLGDLKFIVRYETDACVHDGSELDTQNVDSGSDDILNMMGNLSLSRSDDHSSSHNKSKLVIQERGKKVEINSTLEIKKRASHKPIEIQEVIPQLWVSQTPNLVRAYHSRGTFQIPEVEDVTQQTAEWEENHADNIGRLLLLTRKIIKVVRENGGNATVRYPGRGDSLLVSMGEGGQMLPDDLYAKFCPEGNSS